MSKNKKGRNRKRVLNVPTQAKKKMKAGQITQAIEDLIQRFNFIWKDYTITKINFEAYLWLKRRAFWYRWIPVLWAFIDIWWTSDRMIIWAGKRIMAKEMEQRRREEEARLKKIEVELEKNLEAENADEEQNRLIKNGELKEGYVDRAEEDLAMVADDIPPEGTKVEVEHPLDAKHESEPPSKDLIEKGTFQEKDDYAKAGTEEEILEEANEVAQI